VIDRAAPTPDEIAVGNEEMQLLKEQILPAIEQRRPKQAKLLYSFIDHNGDMETAANALGLRKRTFTRRLEETVFPTIRKTAKKLGFEELLD
jgi:hypothetical protein